MKEAIHEHKISFSQAYDGVHWALNTQPNFKIHLLLATIAIIIGLYVRLTNIEWVLLIFTIFWGLGAEMLNTSIEAMTDLITAEWRKEAKIAKDVSAGMMLTVAIGSVLVAIFLLLPKLVFKLLG